MTNGWQWVLVSSSALAHLNQEWLQQLSDYEHLYVGYSGGLDSTVLLSLVANCPILHAKVTAIHVHHGLSSHADAWALHCENFCRSLGVPCQVSHVKVEQGGNLEEKARMVRYQAFDKVVNRQDALLLAHHQNDQCETVLLNLFRGAGLDGLCAMPEQRGCGQGTLLRPLLHFPRQALFDYAHQHGLAWIEDEMNQDCAWSRVFIRTKIIPLLETKWPTLNAKVAVTAQHCQEARHSLASFFMQEYPQLKDNPLTITDELLADRVHCTQLLRLWLKHHLQRSPSRACIRQIVTTMLGASQDSNPVIQLEDWTVRRYQQKLYLVKPLPQSLKRVLWDNFPQSIGWSENMVVMAMPDPQGVFIPDNATIELRLRQGGEAIHWHGQTQTIKKLLQGWSIPPWVRACLPLVYVNGHLMAIPDYAHSDLHLSNTGGQRYTIKTLDHTQADLA